MSLLVVGLLPGLSAVAACNDETASEADTGMIVMEQEEITDAGITQAIEVELIVDEAVDANMLDVGTVDGVVTLSGSTDNLLAKQRAVEIARATRGVRSVINRIEVNPIPRSDAAIRDDVEETLYLDPATESFEVEPSVDDGTVTLTGTVESWAERMLAEEVAAGVAGVRAIENNIDVRYTTERTDSDIEADVEARLASDVWVDEGLIDVEVTDGAVSLSGTVTSAAERIRARNLAFVAGVETVESDDLTVNPWVEDTTERDRPQTYWSDAAIEEAVEDALVYDPRVLSINPKVSVENGVVTLTGSVYSLRAREAAVEDAENTTGVWRVRDFLKVRPEETLAEDEIERRVAQAIERDPYLERYEIDASVIGNTVYLSGGVDSEFERQRAETVASRVATVTEVMNGLTVYDTTAFKDDRAIRQDIAEGIYWNPWLETDEVAVTVENGVATLTGTVDSHFERSMAREEAFDGGAIQVRNQLEVDIDTAS